MTSEPHGYLRGLLLLDELQQDILAQTVNAALQDSYDRDSMPPAGQATDAGAEDRLHGLVRQLLDDAPPAGSADRPEGGGPGT